MEPGFIHELKELMDEAKREGGKVEILFETDRMYLRCFGKTPQVYQVSMRATDGSFISGGGFGAFQLRREVTHYL